MSIVQASRALEKQVIEWRRAVHRRPEVGMDLPETSAFVRRVLSEIGLRPSNSGAGVVAVIDGAAPGKCVAVRADMDALPMQEDTGLAFASEKPGMMHACGHDAHVAIALGVAKVLKDERHSFPGAVKLIFQPAEEGPGGALPMIQEGALENPRVDAIIACHVGNIWPEARSTGVIGVRYGTIMASCDNFAIRVRGKGGHGAMPHLSVDSVLVAAHVVTSLQSIVSRELKPTASGVITVGKINGGCAENIIAPEVLMEGTIRALDPATREYLDRRVEELPKAVASSMRATAEVNVNRGYPPTINNPEFTRFFQEAAISLFGSDSVREIGEPSMGAEDMAYFLERVPGTYFGLGTHSGDDRTSYPHHHPKFDVDEAALWKGTAVMAETAVRWLKSQAG